MPGSDLKESEETVCVMCRQAVSLYEAKILWKKQAESAFGLESGYSSLGWGITFDWGWKPSVRLADAPSLVQNSFQKVEVNCGLRSDMLSTGMPCKWKMCKRTNWAVRLADGNFGRGTKWVMKLNWSIIGRQTVLPLEGRRPGHMWHVPPHCRRRSGCHPDKQKLKV